jgi:hypothetical protein
MNEFGAFLWVVLVAAAPLIGAVAFASIFLVVLVHRRLRWQWATLAIPIGVVFAVVAILTITAFFMRGSAMARFW